MYRYETHCHTKYTSACSRLDASTLVRMYRENGYDGVVVTDHFLNGNTTVDRSQSWEKQIDAFCFGYEQVAEAGEKVGLKVFFGLEYSYFGTDFLTYGVDNPWLKAHPELMKMSVREYLAFLRRNGVLAVQAHPFREADYIDHIRLFPSETEGIETCNACRDARCNRLAEVLADAYGLLKIGGSDCHSASQPVLSGVETQSPVADLNELIEAIRSGKASVFTTENVLLQRTLHEPKN